MKCQQKRTYPLSTYLTKSPLSTGGKVRYQPGPPPAPPPSWERFVSKSSPGGGGRDQTNQEKKQKKVTKPMKYQQKRNSAINIFDKKLRYQPGPPKNKTKKHCKKKAKRQTKVRYQRTWSEHLKNKMKNQQHKSPLSTYLERTSKRQRKPIKK